VKARHLIFTVLTGTSLIVFAPAPEKAGQAGKIEAVSRPAQDVKIVPAENTKVKRASFAGDARKLKNPDR